MLNYLIDYQQNFYFTRHTFLLGCATYKFLQGKHVSLANLLEVNYTVDSFLINYFHSSQIFNIVSNQKFECFFVQVYRVHY